MKSQIRFSEIVHKGLWGVRRLLKPVEDPFLNLLDPGLAARAEFQRQRETADYQAVFDKTDPLVSILIATYNRAALLRDRSLRSCLNQTYQNIEIIVVGDACTDDEDPPRPALRHSVHLPRARWVPCALRVSTNAAFAPIESFTGS